MRRVAIITAALALCALALQFTASLHAAPDANIYIPQGPGNATTYTNRQTGGLLVEVTAGLDGNHVLVFAQDPNYLVGLVQTATAAKNGDYVVKAAYYCRLDGNSRSFLDPNTSSLAGFDSNIIGFSFVPDGGTPAIYFSMSGAAVSGVLPWGSGYAPFPCTATMAAAMRFCTAGTLAKGTLLVLEPRN